MTASPLLPIANARAAGERLGMRSVIVLQELPDGRWGFTSWGKTKADAKTGAHVTAAIVNAYRMGLLVRKDAAE